ncbi:unnamed protein product [Ceutorhynchus assimilis]|uniref:Uncharacterized protein n=1 Tax=Ceutorhynchus assimilis TaxID=467358 RepID=A0A9N9QFY0_9CUCU|nr:unnamed protein product [Ceutorhynchus assimilis]
MLCGICEKDNNEKTVQVTLKGLVKASKIRGDATDIPGKPSVICLKNNCEKLVSDEWLKQRDSRNNTPEEELVSILKATAQILKEDIRGMVTNLDEYPSCDDIKTGGNSFFPNSLDVFFEELVLKGRKSPLYQTKVSAMKNFIISLFYKTPAKSGLCRIKMESIQEEPNAENERLPVLLDTLWLTEWLQDHNPFKCSELLSISTGIIASPDVNCDKAQEIGEVIFNSHIEKHFTDIQYGNLRKGTKSQLLQELDKIYKPESMPDSDTVYVIDGGFLLHKVSWQKPASYNDIFLQYVNYVIHNYNKDCVIVFDGYTKEVISTKESLQRCRSKGSIEISIHAQASVIIPQVDFFKNSQNKTQFINILRTYFEDVGITVHQAPRDADYLITMTAVELSMIKKHVTVVSEDTDIMVLLIHHAKNKNISMLRPGKAAKDSRMDWQQLGPSAIRVEEK